MAENPDWKDVIRGLTKTQRDAFDQICCGNDAGLHPRTAAALVAKGLVQETEQTLPGRFPVVVKRYGWASWAVHIAWCELCSEEVGSEVSDG
jgi:hypothetical protein